MEPVKVFLVEDDEVYSFLLDQKLSEIAKFDLTTFTTGEECLAHIGQNPDIILLDYSLPGINGLETLMAIRSHKPEAVVLFLSGNDDPALIEACKEAGAYEYFVKDKDIAIEVYRAISRILVGEDREEKSHKRSTDGRFLGILNRIRGKFKK